MAPVLVFRHVPHEGLGTIAPALEAAGLEMRFADAFRPSGPWPPPSRVAGLIVMGGPMGVYEMERHPFLRRESAYIRRVAEAGKPVLGICLGAQLIAHALGARVYPNAKKEIGWYRVRLTPRGRRDPLFRGAGPSPWVFQWHGDTFDLPEGAQLLATSRLCRNQAFRYGESVYGLQFHLEVDGGMIAEWLAQPGTARELAAVPTTRARIRSASARRLPALRRLAGPVFRRFALLH